MTRFVLGVEIMLVTLLKKNELISRFDRYNHSPPPPLNSAFQVPVAPGFDLWARKHEAWKASRVKPPLDNWEFEKHFFRETGM